MTGISAHPESTLLDRVLGILRGGARTATTLCHDVLGLPGAPALICERIAVALLGADPAGPATPRRVLGTRARGTGLAAAR